MNGIWKLNGQFYGWLTDNGSLFSRNGDRIGTLAIANNAFYNHGGAYMGELLNGNRIGINPDHSDWMGPMSNPDGQIYNEPLENLMATEVIGYHSPA
ncbi:hypothetical protein [Galbibacter sp.]|uniref:hypothetical protein n=1 Tax=Galbibacter sp. TaxID=2918471 RepID=UPI003A9014C7